MLEVLDKGAVTAQHPTPILFVHGGYHAAWCWDEHFLDYFAARGYRAVAPSLRGHGGSPWAGALNDCGIADYVTDVAAVAADMSPRPIVVGHSMGGFITQKYLETHDAPAGVLLASAPPRGARSIAIRTATAHPWRTLRSAVGRDMRAVVATPALVRQAFFSAHTPASVVADCATRLQQESHRAMSIDMMHGDLPRPERVAAPMLVLGGRDDWLIGAKQVRATAAAYGTTAEFHPMGHNMMLEPGWAAVAARIDGWLGARGL